MAASGQKLIPLAGMNLDVAPQYLQGNQARYIKSLYYQLSDLGEAASTNGANTGVLKPLPSNQIYCPIDLPEGDNHVIGTYPSRETNELYVWVYNSLSNHTIFRINGLTATADVGAPNPCFDFKLEPQYFVGEGQAYLEVIYLTDTETGRQVVKKDLFWTLGINYQGYLRFDDYLLTGGFDASLFNYFSGTYDRCPMVRMGLPTPNDCIEIEQVPFNPETDNGKNNNLKFSTWQLRVTNIDVFGRPSEHGMISDLFFLSNNECLGASDQLSRCINLTFPAGNPLIDKIQIEYRNCNDEQWYLDSVLELYVGSNLGQWWLRPRNPDVVYNPDTNKITYTFCKDKLCDPIPTSETNRTEPPLPRTSQSITKIGRNISLANNRDKFPPFSKDILDGISVEVIKPVPSMVGETANITVWIRIYNPWRTTFQKVWKKDNDYLFGGIAYNVHDNAYQGTDVKTGYQQYFAVAGQKGYIGYLAGTNNYAVGKQYYLDGTNFVEDTDFSQDLTRAYFMKFEFSGVPKSYYIFRLASHLANPNFEDIRTTSTYVNGVHEFANLVMGAQKTYYKELIINACDSDYDTLTSGEMLVTIDNSAPFVPSPNSGMTSDLTVIDGYVYETKNQTTSVNEKPVSLLQLYSSAPGHSTKNSVITDHNGFYFAGSIGRPVTVTFTGYCNCIKKTIVTARSGSGLSRYAQNVIIGDADDMVGVGFHQCQDFEILPCSRVLVKGTVKLCEAGTGIPNINVVLSRGAVGVTNAEGEFTVIAYDDVINGVNHDKIFVMGGGCAFTACDGGCIEVRNVTITPCSSCATREVNVGNYDVLFITNKGLLSNGRYGISLTGYDWLGRHGFAQTTDKLYFNIPSLNETKTFAPSTVNVVIPPSVTFPDWVDYLTVGITAELNYGGNLIEWIADKVVFVDNAGAENNTAPTQVKIYYRSLNEFNTKNNFNTTTGWQIIPTNETSPRTADIVQFIRNGDGTWFDNPVTSLVKYDQAGSYFLVNYTDSLKGLKENALIRLANPNECANKDSFFELCGKIPVINGKAQISKITLNAFDTYYQYRQIPVPVTSGSGDSEVTITELRQFGFPFEHPSVTDFWGYRCWNIGRFNVRNPYEAELLHLNQVALSGALSVNGQLNYLNYFDEAKKIDFNVNTTGGITYQRAKTGMVLFVCQYRNFIVGYGDNIARLNSQNIVQVPSGEDTFGNPERSTSANYGCQLFDKNTIREIEIEGKSFTQWIDRNRVAAVQNDFNATTDISRYNRANSTIASWLTKKIKYQNEYNATHTNKRYFHSTINPTNFEWLLSEFTVGSTDIVNNERGPDVSKHETFAFDILYKVWKAFYPFTYEMMGYLNGASAGQLLFSFERGVPMSHNGTTYNTFSGIKCNRVYEFVFGTDSFKKKKFQAMEVYCPASLYWSDVITTETFQLSRLLVDRWEEAEYMWKAAFVCDLNTASDPNIPKETGVNKILDGDNLSGTWIDIRLIGDVAKDDVYSELYGVIVFAAGEEQSGT